MDIREALAFDDVLLRPAKSQILPTEADLRSRVTRSIELAHSTRCPRPWIP